MVISVMSGHIPSGMIPDSGFLQLKPLTRVLMKAHFHKRYLFLIRPCLLAKNSQLKSMFFSNSPLIRGNITKLSSNLDRRRILYFVIILHHVLITHHIFFVKHHFLLVESSIFIFFISAVCWSVGQTLVHCVGEPPKIVGHVQFLLG